MTVYVPGTGEKDLSKIIMSLQNIAARTVSDPTTWVPVVTFTTPGDLAVVYSLQNAYYTKIGKLVSVNFTIATSTFTYTTASGNLLVTGLPFPAVNDASYRADTQIVFQGINKASYTTVSAALIGNTSQFAIVALGMGQPAFAVTTAEVASGGNVILAGSVSYVAAS